jgi:hypothetical protein
MIDLRVMKRPDAGAPSPWTFSEIPQQHPFAAWLTSITALSSAFINENAKIRTSGSPFTLITDRSRITP